MKGSFLKLGILLLFFPIMKLSAKTTCTENSSNQYSEGFIVIQRECDGGKEFCFAEAYFLRNRCDQDDLIQYECDDSKEDLHSFRVVKCKAGCIEKRGIGRCVR